MRRNIYNRSRIGLTKCQGHNMPKTRKKNIYKRSRIDLTIRHGHNMPKTKKKNIYKRSRIEQQRDIYKGEKKEILLLRSTEHRAFLCDQKFLILSGRFPKILIQISFLIKPMILLEFKMEFRKLAQFRANHTQ